MRVEQSQFEQFTPTHFKIFSDLRILKQHPGFR
jgi:hypothetical protein